MKNMQPIIDIVVSDELMRHICRHHESLRIYASKSIPAVVRHSSAGRFGDCIVEKFYDDGKFGTRISRQTGNV